MQRLAEHKEFDSEVSVVEQIRKDGTTVWTEVVSTPVFDSAGQFMGIQGVTRDISQRKEDEEAVRASEEKYRNLVESISDAFFSLDENMVVTYFNQEAANVLDRRREEIIGHRLFEVFPEASGSVFEENYSRGLKEKIPLSFETYFEIQPYSNWYHVRVYPQPEGISVFFQVITERKRLEEERLEMERKLFHAQKLESLNIMAGGIAHDFNNQLAIVLGNLELALFDRGLDPEVRLSIENAVKAAKRSAELSRQMQIYTGNTLHHSVDLDLKELLTEKPSLLKLCVSRDVTLNLDIYKILPTIKGDADQLQHLVTNILVNASEAIGDKNGDVTLRTGVMDCDEAYLRRNRLEENLAPGWFVFLEVTDTGCGMDSETQLRLFDPFFTTKFWGRGLGMAEVMGIVKSHHGAIIIDSEAGKGTTIRVLFPASEKAHAPSAQAMDMDASKAEQDSVTGQKTILFVEDDPGLRNLGVKRLERLGYGTIVAGDGEECINVFRERLNEIDLVMLDYKMPKMDGAEAFEKRPTDRTGCQSHTLQRVR